MRPAHRLLFLTVTASSLLFSSACRADNQNFPLTGGQAAGTKIAEIADGLQIDFGTRDAWPNVSWKAPTENGWDWSAHEALVFTLANPGDENLPFHVKINDVGKDGRKKATQFSGMVNAGQSGRYYISLQSRALRDKSGMRALPPLRGDYGTHIGYGIEPGHVEALQIFRSNPKRPSTLIVKSITLEGPPAPTDLNNIIDRYGQYTREDWPGKVKSDADLLAHKAAEEADLKANPGTNDRSKWGGWLGGPRQKATGFFRTQEVNGKWWLVDPDGYLFLSVGIDVVRAGLATRIEGREYMFSWLPEDNDPLAAHFSSGGTANNKRMYDYLAANMKRKYGGKMDENAFGDLAVKRLRSWGFNTIGNWTPEKLGKERQFPYVAAVGTKGKFAMVPGHRGHKMPDPFDPAFAADVEANLLPKVEVSKNDPACIGYFFDNELPWGMPSVDNEHYVLCFGALSLGPESPAKQAFLAMLKQRYTSLDTFNTAWGTKLTSWDELAAPFNVATSVKSPEQRRDFSDYLSLYAEKYFEVVSGTIKRLDPNHLYLGPRFAYWFTEEAVRACAKYADVISFNIYSWNPNTYAFAQKLGKPCIVGEFHFGATDRGMFTGNITVKNQQERGERYMDYVKDVLSEPAFVGCHWFQFYDEPTTGRGQDGENFNIGFLTVTVTPYPELIGAARKANANIYRWHGEAQK